MSASASDREDDSRSMKTSCVDSDVSGDSNSGGESPRRPEKDDPAAMDWQDNLEGVRSLYVESRTGQRTAVVIEPPGPPNPQPSATPQPLEGRPTTGTASSDTVTLEPPEGQLTPSGNFQKKAIGATEAIGAVTTNTATEPTIEGTGTPQPPEGRPVDVSQRAKLYVLKKQKEESIIYLKNALGEKLATYEAVLRLSQKSLSATRLGPGEAGQPASCGSFYSGGDGRMSRVQVTTSLAVKKNSSHSFKTENWTCICCEVNLGHRIFNHRQEEAEAREVVFLTDQAYPPCLPSTDRSKCVVSIRVENGTMKDLLSELLSSTSGAKMAAGSVVLVFSLSYLAAVGTAAYIEDLAAMRRFIKKARGDGILVGALPPLLPVPVTCSALSRSVRELTEWCISAQESDECTLKKSLAVAKRILEQAAEGETINEPTMKIRLPVDMNESARMVYECGSGLAVKSGLREATEEEERLLVEQVMVELKDKLALSTTSNIIYSRVPVNKMEDNSNTVIVVGSSNARNLAAALTAAGRKVGTVTAPNWRAVRGSVDRLAASLQESISLYNPGSVIFYLLDNSVFYARWEDGSTLPARRGHDGRMHVDGDLVVAAKTAQESTFKMVGELLDIAKGRTRTVVTPLPRYVTAACCDDKDHVPNRRSANFCGDIRDELSVLKRHLRDYLFVSGMRDVVVVDPNISVRSLAATEIWGADPVHPRPEIYAAIAADLLNLQESVPGKRKAAQEAQGSDGPQRPRTSNRDNLLIEAIHSNTGRGSRRGHSARGDRRGGLQPDSRRAHGGGYSWSPGHRSERGHHSTGHAASSSVGMGGRGDSHRGGHRGDHRGSRRGGQRGGHNRGGWSRYGH